MTDAPGHSQTEPTQPLPVDPTPQAAAQPQPAAGQPAAPQQHAPQQHAPQQQYAAPYAPPYAATHPAARAAAQHAAAQQYAAAQPGIATFGFQPEPAPAPSAPRKQRGWAPIVGTAAAAALVASFATAGLTGAFGADGNPTPSSLASIGQSSNDTVPVAGSTSDDPDWEKVAAAVKNSVVAIEVTTARGAGQGSGVLIDDQGHVLTNNHVVAGAENDTVTVTLGDGRVFEATIAGLDPTTDLAVVTITDAPDDLEAAALGSSEDVQVGEPVMAVGNPLGLANTVTTGIVSALDRPVTTADEGSADTVVTNAIQIDAAINPGNSGGPLFDAEGRVIGITSSIASLSNGGGQAGSIGLGFAIPVDLAKQIAAQLVDDGTAEHAFLGVSLSDGTATADGATRRGAVVEEITSGSPAAEAGIESGDVVVAIDGDAVGGAESLTAFVRERASGDTATLTVVRDGKVVDVEVTLATRTETAVSEPGSDQGSGEEQEPTVPDEGGNPFDWFFGGQG